MLNQIKKQKDEYANKIKALEDCSMSDLIKNFVGTICIGKYQDTQANFNIVDFDATKYREDNQRAGYDSDLKIYEDYKKA